MSIESIKKEQSISTAVKTMKPFAFALRHLVAGALCAFFSTNSPGASPDATVVTYPAPVGEAVSTEYRVEVNGCPVDVYPAQTPYHDGKYYFAYFDFSGEVNVHVTSSRSLDKVEILPGSAGIAPTLKTSDTIVFTVHRPFKISVERDGQNSPLLLFGNPLEKDAPTAGDSNVVYFGPGVHKPGKITLTSNQTLYLAGGAIVKGGVEARGENIRILGRGILDGNDYPHRRGPTTFMLHLEKCKNISVKDLILRGSWFFTIAPCGCDRVTIDNVKICGSRVLNDDGIDPINSSNVTIHDCFVRTQDDCIAPKGLKGYDDKSCENISVTDCLLWTDVANIFRIGYESDAGGMRDITARNIDVLHFVDTRPVEHFWTKCVFCIQPSNNMPMSGLRFEDFRINAAGNRNLLVKILPMMCHGWSLGVYEKTGKLSAWAYQEPGRYVKNCRFKNIHLSGKAGGRPGMIYVVGAGDDHPVENITFENVTRFGEPVSADSPDVRIGPHASNVKFLP
ncbi:MAG TPA: endo-polygalacturonase [Planctomycetaceae bacterium]|nr:endo-polygalacturonase [Planctomycetaceae bacterium]